MTVQFLKERYHAVVLVSACAHVLGKTHESLCADCVQNLVLRCEVGVRCCCASVLPQAYGAAKDRTLDVPGEVTAHHYRVLPC